jgi:hypothetical protein
MSKVLLVEKVNTLPDTYSPSTLYFVKQPTGLLLDVYLSSSDGTAVMHVMKTSDTTSIAQSVVNSFLTNTLQPTSGAANIGYDSETVENSLNNSKTLSDYTALRAYSGTATGIRLSKTGISGVFYYDSTDTSSSDNGGTIIVCSNGKRFKRAFVGGCELSWFEPNGTGAVSDATVIQNWINAAGVNGTLNMPSGKTFLIDKNVTMLFGQTLNANSSTLKRANQRASVTTSTITAGTTTTFTVSDPSVFANADFVSILETDNLSKYNYTGAKAITKSGSNLVFASAPAIGQASVSDLGECPYGGQSGTATTANYTFPIGSKVAVIYPLFDVKSHCTVRQLKVDGNKSNQQIAFWDLMAEIRIVDSNPVNSVVMDRCEVTNYAGEGMIELSGAPGTLAPAADYSGYISDDETISSVSSHYFHCRLTNGRGNGIHLSAVNRPKVTGGFFYNLNQDVSVGHVGGAVCLSWVGDHFHVEGIYVEKCFAAVGPFNTRSSSHSKVIDSTIKDCVYSVNASNQSANFPGLQQVTVSGNNIINSGYLVASSWQTNTFPGSEVFFHHNFLSGSCILMDTIANGVIDHNVIRNDYFAPVQCTAAVSTNSTTLTVADTSSFTLNQMIFLISRGSRSGNFRVVSKTSTVLTLDRAVGYTFANNPWIYDAERMPYTTVINGTVITSGTTNVFPVEDATLFRVGQWVVLTQVNAGSATNPSRVLVVDTTSTPNTITVKTPSNRTWTATTGVSAVKVWPNSVSGDCHVNIQATRGNCVIDTNITTGNGSGIWTQYGKHTAKGNVINKYRAYGIMTDSTSVDRIYDNEINSDASYSASWSTGIWGRSSGKAVLTNNEITTASTNHTAAQIDGPRYIVAGNTFRTPAGAAAGKSLNMTAATYGEVRNNFTTVAFTGTAASRTTTENIESGTVVLA